MLFTHFLNFNRALIFFRMVFHAPRVGPFRIAAKLWDQRADEIHGSLSVLYFESQIPIRTSHRAQRELFVCVRQVYRQFWRGKGRASFRQKQ